jgi:hypothetical protein
MDLRDRGPREKGGMDKREMPHIPPSLHGRIIVLALVTRLCFQGVIHSRHAHPFTSRGKGGRRAVSSYLNLSV